MEDRKFRKSLGCWVYLQNGKENEGEVAPAQSNSEQRNSRHVHKL